MLPQLSRLAGLFAVGLLKIAQNSIRRRVVVDVTGFPNFDALVETSCQGLGGQTVARSSSKDARGV